MGLEDAVRRVRDLDSLFALLRDELDWLLGEPAAIEDSTFAWTAEDLRISNPEAARLNGVVVRQLRPFSQSQPWGIFLVEFATDRLYQTALRAVLRKLVPKRRGDPSLPSWQHDNLLFICTTGGCDSFTFAHFSGEEANRAVLTTFGWEQESTHIRTLCEFNLDRLRLPHDLSDADSWLRQWRSAFDVDRVSRAFYEDYKQVFNGLQAELRGQTQDAEWAHRYALQFLNRLVFLCFVQRKRWLGNDVRFVPNLWGRYKACAEPADSFFDRWLSVLFFEAFNNEFQAGRADRQHLPGDVRDALAKAPFLNGGLFTRNGLDDAHSFTIPDTLFEMLFDRFNGTAPGFLERYNFTISEDTPLDQEVAVNPEMLGKVYESLVNVSSEGLEEEDRRGTAGIFYTPRIEIDLMCRLAVVDWLTNHLGQEVKPLLYCAVFAYTSEEKETADEALAQQNLWDKLNELLREITVLDPACGSGSFLVGMLLVLDDLQARANRQLGEDENSYDRRKRIIGRSLYGVDCMEWAVHMAELRLWLQLVIETHLEWYQMKHRPLLPNLTFKIRPGDSLVQEIAGVNLSLHCKHLDIPSQLKGRLTRLKAEKMRFYRNEDRTVFRTEDALKNEEVRLFSDILAAKEDQLVGRISRLNAKLAATQRNLAGEDMHAVTGAERKQAEGEMEDLTTELEQIHSARQAIRQAGGSPLFVWDIAFVEIFESDNAGFDIVVGNPPYVRQEKIKDPLHPGEDKALYKAKLQRSVYSAYPSYFGYKPQKDTDARNPSRAAGKHIDGKADLYIYFYLHGLSLLNEKGSFCFITSNSWLDVGYGAELQEFLLRQSHVKLILDNQVKRSFATADVNTIIALLAAPSEKEDRGLTQTARFAMFKVPFENILSPVIFEEIEEATGRLSRPEFTVMPMPQKQLIEEGMASPEDEYAPARKPTVYVGNKWGGKYLRAPDIYWTILEKGRNKFVRLGDIAEVRRGFTTGANDFFCVRVLEETGGIARIRCDDGSEHLIEAEYVQELVLVKAKEIVRPLVRPEDLTYRLVRLDEKAARHRHAGEYIKWGESKGFHARPTTRSRSLWYKLDDRKPAQILIPIGHKRRPVVGLCKGLYASDNLVEVTLGDAAWGHTVAGSVLSTFTLLVYEITGRANFGQGLLKTQTYEVADIPALDPRIPAVRSMLEPTFRNVATRPPLMVYDEVRRPDRQALDDALLRSIGFDDQQERVRLVAELQDITCRIVWSRMAKSGNSRESRTSYDEWLATGKPFGNVGEDAD